MKEYDKIFPINEVHTIRRKAIPIKGVVEKFRFGENARTFFHFLERNTSGLQHIYAVNYQPANNISTEIISEEDFKLARIQMVIRSAEPVKENPHYELFRKLMETNPELFV